MNKILFLPGQVSHIMDCVSIIERLPKGICYKFICMDRYYHNNTENHLKQFQYIRIEDYNTRDFKQILLLEKPSLLISFYDTASIPRLFIKSAKSLAIPTLLIQEGNMLPSEAYDEVATIGNKINTIKKILFKMEEYTIGDRLKLLAELVLSKMRNINYGWGCAGCSRIAVSGPYFKNLLVQRKIDPDKIIVTGQPRFDRLYSSSIKLVKSDKEIIKILWTTLPAVEAGYCSENDWKKYVSMIINTVDKLPSYELFIKLHPLEKMEKYESFAKKPHIHIYRDSLDDLLRDCDILLTLFSTTAIEAAILKKPAIIIKFMENIVPYCNPYAITGAFEPIDTIDELVPTIQKLSHDDMAIKQMEISREKFLYEYNYIQDGNASIRLVSLIMEMMHQSA